MHNSSAAVNTRTITPLSRCKNITEVLDASLVQLHLRIKYYHLICRNHSPLLSCFYGEPHMCLCAGFGSDRQANCFEFNRTLRYDCSGHSDCINGANRLQDRPICARISRYVCKSCFYGKQCQFSSSLFVASITASLPMILFVCKYTVLLIAQILYVTHRSFLSAQCVSLDFLLRVGLSVDQRLSACVSIERAVITTQATSFQQQKG